MRKTDLSKAKFIITLDSDKSTHKIKTLDVKDQRTCKAWTCDQIKERGITDFLNIEDMSETLNWNLGGCLSKFRYSFGQSNKSTSTICAYVFD